MLYTAIFGISAFLRTALETRDKWLRSFWILTVFLFFFVAFRHEVGCDWLSYQLNFSIHGYRDLEHMLQNRQPLYIGSFMLVENLGLKYEWFNVLGAALFFAGLAAFGRRQIDPLAFLILCYPILIINMPMSAVRQAMAIGLLCLAFIEFTKARPYRYLAWVLVAALFHNSAVIFLPLMPLIGERPLVRRIALVIVAAVPGVFALASGELVDVATQRYVDTDVDAAGAVFRAIPGLICGLLYLVFFRRSWRERFPEDEKLAMVGAILMIGTVALLPISTVVGDRVGYFLMPLQAMIFARIPFLELPNRKLFIALPYVLLGGLFVSWSFLSRHFQACYLPYETWMFG